MRTTLDKIKAGQKCRVKELNINDPAVKRRFMDLGIIKGVTIEVIREPSVEGLAILSCLGSKLAMRTDDLKCIEVEQLNKNNDITK